MLLQQVDEQLTSINVGGCRKRIGRWRNNEAGHIAWTSDEFHQAIYEDVVTLHEATCSILCSLTGLTFGIDLTRTYAYRENLANAMCEQLLLGRRTHD